MKKRILSIVLALCMVLTLMPQMAFAAGAGNPYTLKEGTAGVSDSEGPTRLLDGNTGTKWCVTDFESAYIIFSTGSQVNVSGYSITTGNDNMIIGAEIRKTGHYMDAMTLQQDAIQRAGCQFTVLLMTPFCKI